MFDERSKELLCGVNPKLVELATKALEISPVKFRVVEGYRTFERQKELVSAGLSRTLKSKHLDGNAIDIVPVEANWEQWDKFVAIFNAFTRASEELKIQFRWGGDWLMSGDFEMENLLDAPHFELL